MKVAQRMFKTKTKIMVVNRPEKNSSEVQKIDEIDVINRFTYLGSIVENNGGRGAEICQQTQKTHSVMTRPRKIWVDSVVNKTLKIRRVNTLVFSLFL